MTPITAAPRGRADLDLRHTAEPILWGQRWFEGNVIFRRCVHCGTIIWRTPERFVWQHSTPPRRARLAVVRS